MPLLKEEVALEERRMGPPEIVMPLLVERPAAESPPVNVDVALLAVTERVPAIVVVPWSETENTVVEAESAISKTRAPVPEPTLQSERRL